MIFIFIHLIVVFLIAYRLRPDDFLVTYWVGLLIKILAGISVGYYYFYHAGAGDTVTFHHRAEALYLISKSGFGLYLEQLFSSEYHVYMAEARNELFVKIISLIYLVSSGNYWVASIYLSSLSFAAAWYLVRTLVGYYPSTKLAACIIFLFIPSIILWSSGVLKDSIINATLFFWAAVAVKYDKNASFSLWELILAAVALILLFYLKHYLFAMVILVLSLLIWIKFILPVLNRKVFQLIGSTAFVVITVFLVSHTNPRLNLDQLPQTIYLNYQTILDHSTGPTLQFEELAPNWTGLISTIPASLLAGLVRPFPWGIPPIFYLFSLDALIVIILLFMNIYSFRHITIGRLGFLTILFVITLATLLPLASPAFGSLIRYRVAYLPFLLYLLSFTPSKRWV